MAEGPNNYLSYSCCCSVLHKLKSNLSRFVHRWQGVRLQHRISKEVRHHARPQHGRGQRGRPCRPLPRVLRWFRHLLPRISALGHSYLQPYSVLRLCRGFYRWGHLQSGKVHGQLSDGCLTFCLLRHGLPHDQAEHDGHGGDHHGQEEQRLQAKRW